MSENNQSIDERIKEAQDLINIHHDYEKAEKIFLSVVKEDPEDDRGWYGLLRACTCRFDAVEYLIEKHCQKIPERMNGYFEKACETANFKNREIIKKRWALFVGDYKELYELCENKKKRRKEELKIYGKPRDENDEEDEEPSESQQSSSSSADGCWEFLGIVIFILFVLFLLTKFAH